MLMIVALVSLSVSSLPLLTLAAEASYSGVIELPSGEKAEIDIVISLNSYSPSLTAQNNAEEVTIKKGASSAFYSIALPDASGKNLSGIAPASALQYRISGEASPYVSSGFISVADTSSDKSSSGKTVLSRGTVLAGKISLPSGVTAPKGGTNIIVEANYVTSFMKIPEGKSFGFYRLVVPSNLTYKIYFSVISGLPAGLASEWVYSDGEIGKSVTDIVAKGSYVSLKDQTLVNAGIISGNLSLPENVIATKDLTVAISAKLLLDPPGVAKNETPLEALYLGLSQKFIVKSSESSAAFSLSLPKANYSLEYRIIDGLTSEKVNPKGTIQRNNKRIVLKIASKDAINQKFTLNNPLSYFKIAGNIVLPASIKAKSGGLKVNLDFISALYSTNISITVPEGQNSAPFVLDNMLEAAYAVSYNIVEQASEYPEIKYNSQMNMITLDKDILNVSLNLTSEIAGNKPVFALPSMKMLFSDSDKKTSPVNPIPVNIPVGGGKTYYVSSSKGSDDNNGLSEGKAFQSFKNLRKIKFTPGDRILLKSGDKWTDSLYLKGSGSEKSYVQVSSYGKGDKPLIAGKDPKKSILLQLENASFWSIEGISFEKAKLGIFIRYSDINNKNVSIRNCDFDTFTDGPTVAMDSTDKYISASGGQIAFASAIFLGGSVPQLQTDQTVMSGWEVKDCNFNFCDGTVTNNWYRQEFYKDRLKNVFIENMNVSNMTVCTIALNQVNGGMIKNVNLESATDDVFTEFGVAGMFFNGCSNFLIDGYIVNEVNRGYSGDGASIDFEYCNYITVENSRFANIDGMGLELLDTSPYVFNMENAPDRWLLGYNRNLVIKNTTFFNGSRRPHTLPSGEDLFFDVYNRNARATVLFENVTFYEGRGSHGSFSAKSKEFTTKGCARIDLDLVLAQELKTADFIVYSEPVAPKSTPAGNGGSKGSSSIPLPTLLIIIAVAVVAFGGVMAGTYFLTKKRN